MQRVKDTIASTPYEKAAKAMKILMFFNALVLVTTAILHFVYFKFLKSFNGFELTIYLFIFAALFLLFELNKFRLRTWFYFMNYGWGRGVFCLFLGLLLAAAGKSVTWVDILSGVWLMLCGIVFCIISLVNK